MELDYAFLAEKASRLSDNRLVVFGGDVDVLECTTSPALFQGALVVRMLLKPDEKEEGHTYGIEVTSTSGERTIISGPQPLNTKHNEKYPGMPSAAGLIVQLGMFFGKPGIHFLHVMVDGKEVKSLPVAVQMSDTPVQEEKK